MTMMTVNRGFSTRTRTDWLAKPSRKMWVESFFPESIDSGLKSVLLPVDYGRMVNCREWVSDALATVTPDSYGYDEKAG